VVFSLKAWRNLWWREIERNSRWKTWIIFLCCLKYLFWSCILDMCAVAIYHLACFIHSFVNFLKISCLKPLGQFRPNMVQVFIKINLILWSCQPKQTLNTTHWRTENLKFSNPAIVIIVYAWRTMYITIKLLRTIWKGWCLERLGPYKIFFAIVFGLYRLN
jgi:hypothetical protein